MEVLTLQRRLTEAEGDALAGQLLTDDDYDTLVTETAEGRDADTGELLFRLLKGVLPTRNLHAAYAAMRAASEHTTDNRGLAGGLVDPDLGRENTGIYEVGERVSNVLFRAVKKDGTLAKTMRARRVASGIVGFYGRTSRMPYCRTTAFGLHKPGELARAMPYFRDVDAVFAEQLPDRYAAQKAMVERTSPDFVLHGTAFTTVTANRNFQTAVHKDVGDLKEGFGVLTAFSAGEYSGCYFCLPEWRTAIDLRTGDVLLVNVHQWHGNTPFHGKKGKYERVSCVFYYREDIQYCASAEEELERAKRRQPGALNPEKGAR